MKICNLHIKIYIYFEKVSYEIQPNPYEIIQFTHDIIFFHMFLYLFIYEKMLNSH